MPRPRFQNLDASRQRAILAAASKEFAEHGFEAASLNRIISEAGLSKGAMYYYFDDKEDLFVTTVSDAVTRLIVEAGNVATATDARSFWVEVEAWYRRSLELFQKEPAAIGLMRSLRRRVEQGTGGVALAALRRSGQAYLEALIDTGQAVSAIRSDLPKSLLVSVLMSLEEGIDLWLADQITELEPLPLQELAATMTALYRRVAEPALPSKSTASRNKSAHAKGNRR
jgi:AcrR family transcriptional regulator